MSNYIHCPRNSVTPHSKSVPIIEKAKLCDFCWSEYCFCWSEYCMNEWYEMQTQHDHQKVNKKLGNRQPQN